MNLLRQGAEGDAVKQVQERLIVHRCLAGGFDDGMFGYVTARAVREFQEKHRLEVDGVVGPITWTALQEPPDLVAVKPVIIPGQSRWQTAFLAAAQHECSRHVREARSNRGPDVEKYLASVGLDGGNPWCAAFVFWCAKAASDLEGIQCPLERTGSTIEMGHEYTRRGWLAKPEEARAGDIAIWRHSATTGHTGIVESVRPAEGVVLTIEGNTNAAGSREGDGVYRKRREVEGITWLVRVPA